MREIKFRAYDKKFKKMCMVREIHLGKKRVLIDIPDDSVVLRREYRNFDDVDLVQFTGLLDKNGVEIYEGDIVEHINLNCNKEIMFPTKSVVKFGIEYVDASDYEEYSIGINGFYLDPIDYESDYEKGFYTLAFSDGTRVEVIGNIYENQELIK